jgi:hypothetical protein
MGVDEMKLHHNTLNLDVPAHLIGTGERVVGVHRRGCDGNPENAL